MKSYKAYTWFIILFVFLVILAGGIVRTTQSGMGCPDWPKCFGLWIPPTNADQLPPDFEKYLTKQDIDHTFNVYHTWIEYINRLLGALLGILIVIHFVWTLRLRNQLNASSLITAFLMLVTVAFTGWLGKVVVDENLAVFKITLHMFSALFLAALPLFIIASLDTCRYKVVGFSKYLPLILLLLALVQVLIGTQVRQEVDIISKSLEYQQRETWISNLSSIFISHRSLSWSVLILSIWMYVRDRFKIDLVVLCNVFVLFILGLFFSYADFPAFAQPLHLLFGLSLVISILYKVFTIDYKHVS
jgi:heme a synthase